jgi:uncharacterized protein
MDQNEKSIIEDLFNRLQQAEAHAGTTRDSEAEELIRSTISRQPAAPYYMAQAIIVQEQALKNLHARIQELEQELKQRPAGGSFLASLFSGAQDKPSAGGDRSSASSQSASRITPSSAFPSRGSGFLGGALQTATAVAGGMLLANAVGSLFADEAQANVAEEAIPEPEPPTDEDPIASDFGDDFSDGFGGDFGDDF